MATDRTSTATASGTDADRIEREVLIAANPARVWDVLTRPEHISAWFGPGTDNPPPTEIDLRPGGFMVLDHGEYGRFPTLIVQVDAPRYLAYRWASAFPDEPATENNSTLVEFVLTPVGDQTRVTVTESGFASLQIPADKVPTAGYESHAGGWTEVVAGLAKYAAAQ